MKSLKKIIIGSLIVTLTSFVGGVCMHPLSAQAGDSSMGMSVLYTVDHDMQMSENIPLTISTCIFDCINKTPHATVAEKTTVQSTLSLSLAIFQTELPVPIFISDTFGAVGTHPPSPDILSSVVKIE